MTKPTTPLVFGIISYFQLIISFMCFHYPTVDSDSVKVDFFKLF